MSYILDALKRSDRERRQGNIPDLESIHVSPVTAAPSRWSNSSLVLLVVLFGNIVFAGLWAYETMTGDADQPEYVQGSPSVQLPTQPAATIPAPPSPDVRFGQPLPKPLPTDPSQFQSVETAQGDDAFAAYLARQGIASQRNARVTDQNDYAANQRAAAQPVTDLPAVELPEARRRAVPRKLEDLSPSNDPYASLFEKGQTPATPPTKSVPTVPSAPNATTVSRQAEPPVLSVSEAQLLPGEEIIRPSAGTVPAVPPAPEAAFVPPSQSQQGSRAQVPDLALAGEIIEPRTRNIDTTASASGSRVSGPVSWDTVPLITDLPDVVRAELPPLDFNSHMFSSDPRFRTVIINGKSLREQDFLDPRTRLMLITEGGVVLQFDEVRFKVAVLEGWDQ